MTRTLVMGILNVTPDSFHDGGRFTDRNAAVRRAMEMIDEGADIIDVGGESTRPGAEDVALDEEIRRVVPVIEALAGKVRVSVDTTKGEVARAAADAGATIINDVSAQLESVAAKTGAGWVAMHMRGRPRTMGTMTDYHDVVSEVRDYLGACARRAEEAGVSEVWVDPGIGFAKTPSQSLALMGALGDLVSDGVAVLVGASRKSFLGTFAGGGTSSDDRLESSIAVATWAALAGASVVRVHDVADTVAALKLVG